MTVGLPREHDAVQIAAEAPSLSSHSVAHHLWRDYPKPGMSYPDPAVAVANGAAWREIVSRLTGLVPSSTAAFAGIDIGGSALAGALGARHGGGFIEVRKVANVRPELMGSMSRNYVLAEGLAISPHAVSPGQNVVLVDDTLVSGSTALGAVKLLRRRGAVVTAALFIFEMQDQGGRALLESAGVAVHALQRLSAHATQPVLAPVR